MYGKQSLVVVFILFIVSTSGYTMDGTFSGLMYGDYYYMVKNHDKDVENMNGFWFRRIYLTYDNTIDDRFSIRFRYELNSAGDFESSSGITTKVKDAYLQWSLGRHRLVFGISPIPTSYTIEKNWGYRSLAKSAFTFHRMGSTRDFGISAKGTFGPANKWYYHMTVGNGTGSGTETNKHKKIMGAIGFHPIPSITIEIYGDYDARTNDNDRYAYQLYGYYKFKSGSNIGIHYGYQKRDGAQVVDFDFVSFLGAFSFSEKLKFVGRLDRTFAPSPDGKKITYYPFDNTTEATMMIAGVDWKAASGVNFIPNIVLTFYDEVNGRQPDTDCMPRLTLFYKF